MFSPADCLLVAMSTLTSHSEGLSAFTLEHDNPDPQLALLNIKEASSDLQWFTGYSIDHQLR
ncbi:hypothetical protein C0J52_11642 [Blattella germanica]|nr:hypothetical protein C0J52_11642 [Blattella germanica]